MFDATRLQIGHGAQAFVDAALLEQTDGVTRRWHKPERVGDGPVLAADRPWEHTPYFTYSNFNVLRDPTDGLVKCWYEDLGPMRPYQPHPWQTRMLLATSRDGLVFDKPELGIVRVEGQDTNIFCGYVAGAEPSASNPWADVGVHSAAIVIDPTGEAQARYRMLFSRRGGDGSEALVCATSADGVRWAPLEVRPSFGNSGDWISDVSTITVDPASGLFVQFTRHGGQSRAGLPASALPLAEGATARFQTHFPGRSDLANRRRIFRTVSADFLRWSDLVPIYAPREGRDNLDEAHYGCGQFRIGPTHFGTVGILRYVDNEMDVRLIYSHDGMGWHDTDNARAFLAPRGSGHWDAHMVAIVSPPVRVGDRWYFYHGGALSHHDYWWAGPSRLPHVEARDPAATVRFGMGVATLRYEGVVSLEACGPRLGQIVTRPLEFRGLTLTINARVRPGGALRVALLDSGGSELAGYGFADCIPFTGDTVKYIVTWTHGTALPDAALHSFRKLAFRLDNAELFTFAID